MFFKRNKGLFLFILFYLKYELLLKLKNWLMNEYNFPAYTSSWNKILNFYSITLLILFQPHHKH